MRPSSSFSSVVRQSDRRASVVIVLRPSRRFVVVRRRPSQVKESGPNYLDLTGICLLWIWLILVACTVWNIFTMVPA